MTECRCGCGQPARMIWASPQCIGRGRTRRCKRCDATRKTCKCDVMTAEQRAEWIRDRVTQHATEKRGFAITPELVATWTAEYAKGRTYLNIGIEYRVSGSTVRNYIMGKASCDRPTSTESRARVSPCARCYWSRPSTIVEYECFSPGGGQRACMPLSPSPGLFRPKE